LPPPQFRRGYAARYPPMAPLPETAEKPNGSAVPRSAIFLDTDLRKGESACPTANQRSRGPQRTTAGEFFGINPHMLCKDQRCACSIDRPPSFPPPGKGPQRTDRRRNRGQYTQSPFSRGAARRPELLRRRAPWRPCGRRRPPLRSGSRNGSRRRPPGGRER